MHVLREQEEQERVLITAGTLHPKPIRIRNRSRPLRPKGCISGSRTTVSRSRRPLALYAPSTNEYSTTVGAAQTNSNGPIVTSPYWPIRIVFGREGNESSRIDNDRIQL